MKASYGVHRQLANQTSVSEDGYFISNAPFFPAALSRSFIVFAASTSSCIKWQLRQVISKYLFINMLFSTVSERAGNGTSLTVFIFKYRILRKC